MAAGQGPAELRTELARLGVLTDRDSPAAPAGTPLAEAVLHARDEHPDVDRVWTADELLLLPQGLAGRPLRRALRAFIAGFPSRVRLRAYGQLALRGARTVWGDLPAPAAAERSLAQAAGLDPAGLHVVDLTDGSVASVPGGDVDSLGARAPHRLGTVLSLSTRRAAAGPPLHLTAAMQSTPNLRFTHGERSRSSGFGANAAEAELVARAETAERYAAGDVAPHDLRRARSADLDGAIPPARLFAHNERQYERTPRHEPGDELLWVEARTLAGEPRWLPAATVFFPFADPEARPLPPVTSSGMAAYDDPAEARRRGLAELVERDAFMWHWVQRVGRERIDPQGLGERSAAVAAAVRAQGFEVRFLNLSLEAWPVILCAVFSATSLRVAAACRADPAAAAEKALLEAAAGVLWQLDPGPEEALEPEEIRGPADHYYRYTRVGVTEETEFLVAGADEIELEDVPTPAAGIEELTAELGEPLSVDLTTPATAPFHVVRAAVPGLVPISFGYDREPLGMTRLAEPKLTRDGRTLGSALDLDRTGPILPHPFP